MKTTGFSCHLIIAIHQLSRSTALLLYLTLGYRHVTCFVFFCFFLHIKTQSRGCLVLVTHEARKNLACFWTPVCNNNATARRRTNRPTSCVWTCKQTVCRQPRPCRVVIHNCLHRKTKDIDDYHSMLDAQTDIIGTTISKAADRRLVISHDKYHRNGVEMDKFEII